MNTKSKFIEGQIYATHTGYCMQETRFYQVIGFTPSKKSVIVRRLTRHYAGPSKKVVPFKNDFDGPARTLRITPDTNGNDSTRVGFQDYVWADSPWDGTPQTRDYSVNFEKSAE